MFWLSSSTNPCIEKGLLVQSFEPSGRKDVNLPQEEFTAPEQLTHLYDRQSYEWTAVHVSEPTSRMFSSMLMSGTTSFSECTVTLGRQPVSCIVW